MFSFSLPNLLYRKINIIIYSSTLICYLIIPWSQTESISASYIRINQVGYFVNQPKWGIVGSEFNLEGQTYYLQDTQSHQIVDSATIGPSIKGKGPDTPFDFNHLIDFSTLQTEGFYQILLSDRSVSHEFRIGHDIYNGIIDSLLFFLKVARCGDTNPALHAACHLYDGTNIDLDLTGGWHDAGDYLKFTRQEAYTTYLLLLSYEINRKKNYFILRDRNGNGIDDILDEAKIGLDYLVKLFPDENTFILQVGDMEKDHSQGTRLPGNDKLTKNNRPATIGFERDPLCKYAAAMALGYNLYKEREPESNLIKNYLRLAKIAYERAKLLQNGHFDKLCLSAIELYLASGEEKYLKDAKGFNVFLSSSSWGHYSDFTNFAHVRLTPFFDSAGKKLKESIIDFYEDSENNLFGFNIQYVWGSLYVALSSANAGWFYFFLTNDKTYNQLQRNIGNYLLGLNPWGVCFISSLGKVYPKNIHNGVARVLKNQGKISYASIPGAVAEGPFNRSKWEENYSKFVPTDEDIYHHFHTSECVYHDHVNDYVTNEPCIYGVAETILFFSLYQKYIDKFD